MKPKCSRRRARQIVRLHLARVAAEDAIGAGCDRPVETAENVHQRRLARTGLADDGHHLARLDGEAEILQRDHHFVARRKFPAHIVEFDQRPRFFCGAEVFGLSATLSRRPSDQPPPPRRWPPPWPGPPPPEPAGCAAGRWPVLRAGLLAAEALRHHHLVALVEAFEHLRRDVGVDADLHRLLHRLAIGAHYLDGVGRILAAPALARAARRTGTISASFAEACTT